MLGQGLEAPARAYKSLWMLLIAVGDASPVETKHLFAS